MEFLGLFPQFHAFILSALPNIIQAFFAGVGDYYTWQLAERLYGVGSTTAWTTVRKPWLDLKSLLIQCLPAPTGHLQPLGMVLFNKDILKLS